jgi:hypothetical protein
MNRKNATIALTIIGIAVIAGTSVTASIPTMHAPLYILRMEQTSNSMNFSPSAVNGFIYTAEKGFELSLGIGENCINGYCGNANPYATGQVSCVQTECDTCLTYCGQNTCQYTCPITCATCLPKRTCFVTLCIDC